MLSNLTSSDLHFFVLTKGFKYLLFVLLCVLCSLAGIVTFICLVQRREWCDYFGKAKSTEGEGQDGWIGQQSVGLKRPLFASRFLSTVNIGFFVP